MTPRRKRTHRQANLIAELHNKAHRETQAKNIAYYYIVLCGRFADFTAFSKAYKGKNAHKDCVRTLANLNTDGNPIGKADVDKAKVAWETWMQEHFGKNIFD